MPNVTPELAFATLEPLFAASLHAKRLRSLADGVTGVLHAAELAVNAIGRGLAAARGTVSKHAIKQVDRLLSNPAYDPDRLATVWIPFVLAQRTQVQVNLDWTEFAADDHATLTLAAQTGHGRATVLLWKTISTKDLKGQRNDHEDALLRRFAELVPKKIRVTIVADRGFGDSKLYAFLSELGFEYIIRFRSNIQVTNAKHETRAATAWLGRSGRLCLLRNASVTGEQHPIATVAIVQDPGMKEPWCLVASDPTITGRALKAVYGKRFTIEESFRDIKDGRFGLGLSAVRVERPERRDRLLLLAVLAMGLMSLLGAAGEAEGLDRLLKVNTSKKRQYSLVKQGYQWFELIPNMPEARLRVLMMRFEQLLIAHQLDKALPGIL